MADRTSSSASMTKRARQQDVGTVDHNGNPMVSRQQEFYEGAIPHPDHLEKFEQILPGAADRILQLTEREQAAAHKAHEKDQEFRDELLEANREDNRFRQVIALIALFFCLSASVGLAALGAVVAAGIVGGTTVVGVIASFLGSHFKSEKGSKKQEPQPKPEPSNQILVKKPPSKSSKK